ncbi:MAG: hypothetical protein OFPII_39070 [Osedax symbiont Rs1]|nr:MAG: hypothetical protein OFPII_39070 [Osedax symbiont Rs1]
MINFKSTLYRGEGVNHLGEKFTGTFNVEPIGDSGSYSYNYTTVSENSGETMHRESGIITEDEYSSTVVSVYMTQLPSLTKHILIRDSGEVYRFGYEGEGMMEQYDSELYFEFNRDGFIYRHCWGQGVTASEKTRCDLRRVLE